MDKYEEALERARQGLPMDEVFPELKESEDEKFRKYILQGCKECVEVNKGLELSMDTTKKLLSYLEKQKEQQPADWSEDDEQYLLVCKNALNKYQRSDHWDANIISKWLEERLKSLRPQPHWKPSDEQIDTLEAVVGMIHPTDTRYDAVFGLLEELKAL